MFPARHCANVRNECVALMPWPLPRSRCLALRQMTRCKKLHQSLDDRRQQVQFDNQQASTWYVAGQATRKVDRRDGSKASCQAVQREARPRTRNRYGFAAAHRTTRRHRYQSRRAPPRVSSFPLIREAQQARLFQATFLLHHPCPLQPLWPCRGFRVYMPLLRRDV